MLLSLNSHSSYDERILPNVLARPSRYSLMPEIALFSFEYDARILSNGPFKSRVWQVPVIEPMAVNSLILFRVEPFVDFKLH